MQEGPLPNPVPLPVCIRPSRAAHSRLATCALVGAWFAFAFAAAAACGATDPAASRAAEVEAILEDHLEHEDALLDILERNRGDATAAEDQLATYLAEHGAAMAELCAKRRLLEAEPTALATAMRGLAPEMTRIFARRQVLAASAPELLLREKVRSALAMLDAL